jgi:hypothetical protein
MFNAEEARAFQTVALRPLDPERAKRASHGSPEAFQAFLQFSGPRNPARMPV